MDEFSHWYGSLVDDESRAMKTDRDRAALERWFRALYDADGPVAKERAVERFQVQFLARARSSVQLVLRDIERTTTLQPTVTIDAPDDTIRIRYRSDDGSGGYETPSMQAFDTTDALIEVADYLQDFVIDDLHAVWPVCDAHGAGAHPAPRDNDAVWWCRAGAHSLGRIGSLPARATPR